MTAHTTIRTSRPLSAWLARIVAVFAVWAWKPSHRIDAPARPRRHRMGSWEASASLRARALIEEAEQDAVTH